MATDARKEKILKSCISTFAERGLTGGLLWEVPLEFYRDTV
jgi:hypothetical protein